VAINTSNESEDVGCPGAVGVTFPSAYTYIPNISAVCQFDSHFGDDLDIKGVGWEMDFVASTVEFIE
jgi:hypothetical protein